MYPGLPGGSNGGTPITTCGFWVVILSTLAVMGAFAGFVWWTVNDLFG